MEPNLRRKSAPHHSDGPDSSRRWSLEPRFLAGKARLFLWTRFYERRTVTSPSPRLTPLPPFIDFAEPLRKIVLDPLIFRVDLLEALLPRSLFSTFAAQSVRTLILRALFWTRNFLSAGSINSLPAARRKDCDLRTSRPNCACDGKSERNQRSQYELVQMSPVPLKKASA